MQTGLVESWRDSPSEWGPLYPFVGWEGWMFAASVLFCIGFFAWKFKLEREVYRREVEQLRNSGETLDS